MEKIERDKNGYNGNNAQALNIAYVVDTHTMFCKSPSNKRILYTTSLD